VLGWLGKSKREIERIWSYLYLVVFLLEVVGDVAGLFVLLRQPQIFVVVPLEEYESAKIITFLF
jgi:hypothetical protein